MSPMGRFEDDGGLQQLAHSVLKYTYEAAVHLQEWSRLPIIAKVSYYTDCRTQGIHTDQLGLREL
jgi:hypothetical protein